ncbi:hypothetical protein C8R48DRAFT_668090 [Suillus tomentosus]|nr:hypothetical protein C8R48DRAFT_668090 [Suillus tomentosus]
MTTIPTEIEQQMLLERSVPIWPTQLRRYTEMSSLVPQRCDYSVPMMQIEPASINRRETRGDWEDCTHPSGATYHYNAKMNTFAEMNMRSCSDEELQRLGRWIQASRLKIDDEQWLMVVEPILMRGEEVYTYYCVVPKNRIITWLQTVNAYLLFQECATASHWNHKRLELEAQFWKHVEYFSRRIDMSLLEVRMLRHQLNWYRVGEFFGITEMAAELAIAVDDRRTEELAGPDGIVKESGIAICGHHEYLNHHGQPEARLMRTHSLGEKRGGIENSPFMTGVAFTMFWIPIMVLKRLRNIYVDGLINGVDIRGFTDSFNAQAKAQTTVASVILAVDASILVIPGLGAQVATKTLCSISFVLNVLPTRENANWLASLARRRDHQSKIFDHRSSGTSNDVTGHKVISVLCAVLLPGTCASSAWVVLQEFKLHGICDAHLLLEDLPVYLMEQELHGQKL